MKRYKARYPMVFPILDTKENTIKLVKYFEENKIDLNRPNRILFKSKKDHASAVCLAILLSLKKFPSLVYMNSYDLVDIYLQKHEVYESLSSVKSDIFFMTRGYGELPNVQQMNMINYMINQYRAKTVFFYLKGRDTELECMAKDNNFKEIDIDSILGCKDTMTTSTYDDNLF